MRDPIILLVHLIATLARLMGPGGLRSVVAESLLVKQQLLILIRSRHRAPNLRASDRILTGVCALFMRPGVPFFASTRDVRRRIAFGSAGVVASLDVDRRRATQLPEHPGARS